jgi:hypothetical protein
MTQYHSVYKWLTFGIILLLVSVTIIPSITHSIVTASNTNKSKDINYYNTGDIILIFLKKIFGMRIFLYELLYAFSVKIEYHGDPPRIRHPIVYLFASALFFRIYFGISFWSEIARILNFQWTGDDIAPYW